MTSRRKQTTTDEALGFTSIGFEQLNWNPDTCMRYYQAHWVLRQLAFREVLTARQTARVHAKIAAAIGWHLSETEYAIDPALVPLSTVDVKQWSPLLRCESCGCGYGRQIWHSTSVHRSYVFECVVNHAKRGTCAPPHIYQEHLGTRMNLLMRSLIDKSGIMLQLVPLLPNKPGLAEHLRSFLKAPAEVLPVYPDDICSVIQSATMTSIPSIEVTLCDGSRASVPVTPRWTPIMRRS